MSSSGAILEFRSKYIQFFYERFITKIGNSIMKTVNRHVKSARNLPFFNEKIKIPPCYSARQNFFKKKKRSPVIYLVRDSRLATFRVQSLLLANSKIHVQTVNCGEMKLDAKGLPVDYTIFRSVSIFGVFRC